MPDAGAYPGGVSLPPLDRDSTRMNPPQRRVVLTAISRAPLDVRAHEAAVEDGGAGAVVTFCGQVRDHDGGAA